MDGTALGGPAPAAAGPGVRHRLLLTPVVYSTSAQLGARPKPHVYACTHLANSASLLLPVSNLTNLLAFAASGLAFPASRR